MKSWFGNEIQSKFIQTGFEFKKFGKFEKIEKLGRVYESGMQKFWQVIFESIQVLHAALEIF